jgi:hypothetical protein
LLHLVVLAFIYIIYLLLQQNMTTLNSILDESIKLLSNLNHVLVCNIKGKGLDFDSV